MKFLNYKLAELLHLLEKYNPGKLFNELITNGLDCFVYLHSDNEELVSFMIDNYDIDIDWIRSEIGSLSSGKNLGGLFDFERIIYGERLYSDSGDVQSLVDYLEELAI